MYLIVSDYRSADHRWTTNRLAEHLDLPGAALEPDRRLRSNARSSLLLAEDETWVPARDPQTIELVEVLDAVRHDTAGPRLEPDPRHRTGGRQPRARAEEAMREEPEGQDGERSGGEGVGLRSSTSS